MEVNIMLRNDSSEIIQYDYENYSAYIRKGFLSYYPNYKANPHWHDDIEFIYIISGYMMYNINGIKIKLEKNNGIIVNTKQLHFGFTEDFSECEFICVLLHPMLISSIKSISNAFVNPVLIDNTIPFIHLHHDVPWEKSILSSIKEIYNCHTKSSAPL